MRAHLAFALLLAACKASGPPPVNQGQKPPPMPPADAVGGFSIALPPLTLMPGDEQLPCFIFPLTVDGPSRMVGGGLLDASPGMHHGNITTRPQTGDGVRPCPNNDTGSEALDILAGGAVLFASSTQIQGSEWQSFPKGMAYRVKDGFEIVARMHYLNAANTPLTVAPTYRWWTIDEASLTQEIAPFAWEYSKFMIPPQSSLTVKADCLLPRPMHVVELLPHMHRLGREFDAAYYGGPLDGQQFLHSPGYDPENGVLLEYDPSVDLSQGDGASFACTWDNTTDQTIREGIGTNEMCILFGYAWPPGNTFSALAAGGSCVVTTPPPSAPVDGGATD